MVLQVIRQQYYNMNTFRYYILLMYTPIAFQVIPTSNEINHTVGVPNGVPNGVPKVTITYADQLDLEESVVPTISPNTKLQGLLQKYWPLLTILWHKPPFIQIKKRFFVRKNSQTLATDPVFKTETNVVIKKKNGFKTKLNSFSPMEPIEECSMEMSSEKKDEADSR